MTYMKIMYCHRIFTPGDYAFVIIMSTRVGEPYLFTKSFWNRDLFSSKALFFWIRISDHLSSIRHPGSSFIFLSIRLSPIAYRLGIIMSPSIAIKKTKV